MSECPRQFFHACVGDMAFTPTTQYFVWVVGSLTISGGRKDVTRVEKGLALADVGFSRVAAWPSSFASARRVPWLLRAFLVSSDEGACPPQQWSGRCKV